MRNFCILSFRPSKNKKRRYSQEGKGSSDEVRAELAVGHIGRGRRGLGRCVGVGGHSDWPALVPAPSGLGRCGRGELSRAMLFVTAVLIWNKNNVVIQFCRVYGNEANRKKNRCALIDT